MQYGDDTVEETIALPIALGVFSLVLGAAALVRPRGLARLIGALPDGRTTTILQASGARELASGIAILAQPKEAKWLWSRVGGDALDLATLARSARGEGPNRTRLALAAIAVVGVAALDLLAARSLSASDAAVDAQETGEQAITVKAPLEAVEAGWEQWCASRYARLASNYVVRFEPAPGARGTEVHLAGGGSKSTIREELRRFKQQLETGEISVSDGPGPRMPVEVR